MAQLCLWIKIYKKQWLVLRASAFQCNSVPQMRQFYQPRSKWASSEKMIFLAKIGFFCNWIASPLNEAYTQPYSFGGRIKLIICQIRHELSVTIHDISTSWKKSFRWRSLYNSWCKLTENRYATQVEDTESVFVWQQRKKRKKEKEERKHIIFHASLTASHKCWLYFSTCKCNYAYEYYKIFPLLYIPFSLLSHFILFVCVTSIFLFHLARHNALLFFVTGFFFVVFSLFC